MTYVILVLFVMGKVMEAQRALCSRLLGHAARPQQDRMTTPGMRESYSVFDHFIIGEEKPFHMSNSRELGLPQRGNIL